MNFQIKLARLALAACFPAVFEAALPGAFAQGSLAPPGAPAPTMKTLDQIEARTPISAAPFTISQPGSYYLTNNVTVSSGDAITIAADNVTLDLNGFTIVSTRPAAAGDSAILLDGQRKNIAIFNGHISSGVTIIGPMFTGGGFGYGIRSSGDPGNSVRVKDVSVTGVLYYGIFLSNGSTGSTVVESCSVNVAGSYGIFAHVVSDSSALNCEVGIRAITARNCVGTGTNSGTGLIADIAESCFGVNFNGNGVGLYAARAANNCSGQGAGFGTGLFAGNASNCYGESSNGTGLDARVALNSYGTTSGSSSFGLRADSAQNCYGYNGGAGTGLYGIQLAIGCIGYAYSGTGLSAFIANSCRGTTTVGTAQAITFKYNMP